MSEQDRMVMVYVPTQTFVMGGGTQAVRGPGPAREGQPLLR